MSSATKDVEGINLRVIAQNFSKSVTLSPLVTSSTPIMNRVNGDLKKSEFMKEKNLPNEKPNFDWTFKIELKTTRKVVFFDSPSHNITLLNQNEKGT